MYIEIHNTYVDNIGIPKHKNTTSFFRYETFYNLWVKGFFDMRKREAQFFYADFSTCPKPRATPAARSRWAPKVNRLLRTLKLHSLTFLKSPKSSAHDFGAWRHSHPMVTFSIWDFYFDISEWHILPARAWTPALMLHLTNPCAKRKVLSRTKPKGKIYKVKSLGHYITNLLIVLLSLYIYRESITIYIERERKRKREYI